MPEAVAVDSKGNVYVADTVTIESRNSAAPVQYVTQWGTFGSGNAEFNGLDGVAVDSSGNLYVTDESGNNRVEKFGVMAPILLNLVLRVAAMAN